MALSRWKEEIRQRHTFGETDNLSGFVVSGKDYFKDAVEFGYPGKKAVPITYSEANGTIEQSVKSGTFARIVPTDTSVLTSGWMTDKWWDVDTVNLDWIKVLDYATDKNDNKDYLILDVTHTGGPVLIGLGLDAHTGGAGVTFIPHFGTWNNTKFDWNSFSHWHAQGTNAWVEEVITDFR
tara:strand:+ start:3585 stop:4124 length:540 start_codon:yes stop_codon:yes gene_type:complete